MPKVKKREYFESAWAHWGLKVIDSNGSHIGEGRIAYALHSVQTVLLVYDQFMYLIICYVLCINSVGVLKLTISHLQIKINQIQIITPYQSWVTGFDHMLILYMYSILFVYTPCTPVLSCPSPARNWMFFWPLC